MGKNICSLFTDLNLEKSSQKYSKPTREILNDLYSEESFWKYLLLISH